MPAVCNLFSALTKETGNVFLFSQYTEDLTHQISAGSIYKVVPSKFICAEMDYSKGDGGSPTNWNKAFPLWLQNNYENGVAVLRNRGNYSPETARNLFWNCLFGDPTDSNSNYLSISNGSVDQFKYVGTIDLQSYNSDTGMGYSEIYCYVPSEARRTSIGISYDASKSTMVEVEPGMVEGYADGEEVPGVLSLQHGRIRYYTDRRFAMSFEDDPKGTTSSVLDDNSFKFNTIIVLYDILEQRDGEFIVKASDIPMAMYLTGLIRGQEYSDEGYPLNEVTKYVSNEDIYGAGTTYGLRICTRFTPTPGTDRLSTDFTVESGDGAALSRALGAMADTAQRADDILEQLYKSSQAPKELLAIFKNSRTNVPYIKEVNGQKMWFCNGRSLDATVEDLGDGSTSCEPASATDIQTTIDRYEQDLVPTLSLRAASNIALFEVGTSKNVTLTFDIFYKNERIDVSELDSLTVNNQTVMTASYSETIGDTKTFIVQAVKGTLVATASVLVSAVHPSWVGGLTMVDADSVQVLTKVLYSTWKNTWIINSNSGYPCIAYPASYGRVGIFRDADSGVDITSFWGEIDENTGLCAPEVIQIGGLDYNVYKYSQSGIRNSWRVLAEVRK